jgi:alpha-galactosidase
VKIYLLLVSCSLFMLVSVARAGAERWDIVRPEEMSDAREWFDGRVEALTQPSGGAETQVRGLAQGWGWLHSGWSVNHFEFNLNGKRFESGLGSHADGVIELTPPPLSKRLSGVCGIDSTEDTRKVVRKVIFSIEADGKEIWRAGPLTVIDDGQRFDLDLHGGKVILLKSHAVDDASYTPADWVDLQLIRADGSSETIGNRKPFSRGGCVIFVLGGKASSEFIDNWKLDQEEIAESNGILGTRIIRTDPISGLQCVIELKRYTHFPVVEWTVHLKNTGNGDTPIVEDFRSMDLDWEAGDGMVLHHNTGGQDVPEAFEPHVTPLVAGDALRFAPMGGRTSSYAWPYFNLEYSRDSRGMIAAIGWPGQWAAEFKRPADRPDTVLLRAGQELTHFKLHSGEEVRGPLSVLMFYRGDAVRSQNVWRRWMLECNTPRIDGKLPGEIFSASLGLHQSEKSEIDGINLYSSHGAKLTYWWMDAGWYPCEQWWTVGTWEPDPRRFPAGIKPISDLAHAHGMKMILWLEPERVHPGSWLFKNHPEWLLGTEDDKLLNLGNPDAWHWLVEHVDHLLTAQGIDVYRQDFNKDALAEWRGNDEPDRQGITEIRHIEGYLSYWDELHRRHPDMLIDTCASGGRRLDLETLRRSVPLWRCDHNGDAESNQSQTFGLASWLPLYGSGTGCDTAYTIRSEMLPFFAFGGPSDDRPMDWDLYHREADHWHAIREDLAGDFYPLLPYSLSHQTWMAWQFDRPDLGKGVVQVFRRAESPFTTARFTLSGLDPNAMYEVTDVDSTGPVKLMSGKTLGSDGLEVRLDQKPAAGIFEYVRK